jgi:hypothetical protein
MTYDVVNPGPGLGQAQTCSEVKSVDGTPPTLYLNSNDGIYFSELSEQNVISILTIFLNVKHLFSFFFWPLYILFTQFTKIYSISRRLKHFIFEKENMHIFNLKKILY